MAKSSFSCQKGQSTTGRLLQCCGQPSMICCIRSCRTWSSLVAFWIWAILLCTYGWLVISWIVTSKPLMTVFPLGLTLLSASATATLCPGRFYSFYLHFCCFKEIIFVCSYNSEVYVVVTRIFMSSMFFALYEITCLIDTACLFTAYAKRMYSQCIRDVFCSSVNYMLHKYTHAMTSMLFTCYTIQAGIKLGQGL